MKYGWIQSGRSVLTHYLPKSLQNILKKVVNTYFRQQGFPLRGRLVGFRMCAPFNRSYFEGSYESQVCQVIEDMVRPGSSCIDVGTHFGYITLLMAKLVGETGSVIGFEAHPDNVTCLKRSIAVNHLERRI